MNARLRFCVAIVLFGLASIAIEAGATSSKSKQSSQDLYILPNGANAFVDKENNTYLNMSCTGDYKGDAEIVCTVSYNRFYPASDEDRKRGTEEINKTKSEDLKKQISSMCGPAMEKTVKQVQNEKLTYPPERKAIVEENEVARQALCRCSTDACIREKMVEMIYPEGVCTVSSGVFPVTMTRLHGQKKWMYNPGPEGVCNVVQISTLEEGKAGGWWIFTEERVSADTTGHDGLCKNLKPRYQNVFQVGPIEDQIKVNCKKLRFVGTMF